MAFQVHASGWFCLRSGDIAEHGYSLLSDRLRSRNVAGRKSSYSKGFSKRRKSSALRFGKENVRKNRRGLGILSQPNQPDPNALDISQRLIFRHPKLF